MSLLACVIGSMIAGAILVTTVLYIIAVMGKMDIVIVAPLSGVACGLLVAPAGFVFGHPITLTGFVMAGLVSVALGEWNQGAALARAILSSIGFLVVTGLMWFLVSTGGVVMAETFLFFSDAMSVILRLFNIDCTAFL